MLNGIIRVGDTTSHGGTVMTGSSASIDNGKPIARVGDKVYCPIHGATTILEGNNTFIDEGRPIAYHGCQTSCGATLVVRDKRSTFAGWETTNTSNSPYNPSPARFQQPQQRNSFVDTSSDETPCDHPDQALDLAAYIVDEIQKNTASEPAQKMRRWNSVAAEEEEAKWRDRLNDPSLSQRERDSLSLARVNFRQMESVARQSALAEWTRVVRQEGPWDHKFLIPEVEDENGSKKFSTLGRSSYRWHHKYGEYEYYYDIWSNIHYGYLGVYCGFQAGSMLDGAGLEQVGTDILDPGKDVTDRSDMNGPGLRRYDDSTDNLSIRIGFELFEEHPDPSTITADIVMEKVATAPYPIRIDSKILHNCETARSRNV